MAQELALKEPLSILVVEGLDHDPIITQDAMVDKLRLRGDKVLSTAESLPDRFFSSASPNAPISVWAEAQRRPNPLHGVVRPPSTDSFSAQQECTLGMARLRRHSRHKSASHSL